MSKALTEFLLEPGVYRLGQFSPVSIRDQVVRANYLIQHLSANTELEGSTRLLVIGAGAAGVTAAIEASRLGVRSVILVERARTVMPLQSRSRSRWLDPVQYDWPAAHWSQRSWPVDESPRRFTAVTVPFAALSAAVAEDWALDFQNRTATVLGAAVSVRFNTEAKPWVRTSAGLSVDLLDTVSGVITPVVVDLIVLAVGFGLEDTTVPDTTRPGVDFRGLDFWSDDKFETPTMGIPSLQHGVLVSGGGDGALQDFVRLSTGLASVGDILQAVWQTSQVQTAWKEQMSSLWHWEDHANRARTFSPTPLDDCELQRRLHQRHAEAVEKLVRSTEWAAVVAWFDQALGNRPIGVVELALKCDHFNWCYGLNRTGALITIEYLKHRGRNPVKTNVALKSTAPVGHTACNAGCWGQVHDAHLAHGVSCADDAAAIRRWPPNKTSTEKVDGLVIRHGIDPAKFGPTTLDRLKPQVVPFHLP